MLIQTNVYIVVMVLDSIHFQNLQYHMVISLIQIDNKIKSILIFSKGATQELIATKLTVKTQYSINFSKSNRKFCLSLHYNGRNKFLFVNTKKMYKCKAKKYEIKKPSHVFRKCFRRFFS